MSIRDNSLGPGRLAAVAWTPLDGTGLDFLQAEQVSDQVDSARTVAKAVLRAIECAVNQGACTFTLSDLSGFGLISALPTGEDTADEWAAFMSQALGVDLAASQSDNLNGWRRTAEALQGYAAELASRLSPNGGADGGGGVTHANGRWYANGQVLSLLDLFTAVRVNRLANYDDSIDGYVEEIRDNQRRLAAAREWGSTLRAMKPSKSDGKAQLDQATVSDFKRRWNIDPLSITTKAIVGSDKTRDAWDAWLSELKAFIDKTDTQNQTLKGLIDQKSNRRGEVIEAMSNFAGKESKTGSRFASNLG